MGYFSWKTADTHKSISNRDSARGALPVYFLIPQEFGGGYIKEDDYDGYGRFGGEDAYALLARWNWPDKCTGEVEKDRQVGIVMFFMPDEMRELKYPFKITEAPMKYEEVGASVDDPAQG